MAEAVQITGIDQVNRALTELPSLLIARVFYEALDRAGGVIAAEIAARAPEGEYEELRDNVIVVVGVDHEKQGGTALIGFSRAVSERTEKPLDLIAYWVEVGHVMETHDHRKPKNGLQFVPPHPFVRPAFAASGDRAIEVFQEALIDGLAKAMPSEGGK